VERTLAASVPIGAARVSLVGVPAP